MSSIVIWSKELKGARKYVFEWNEFTDVSCIQCTE